MLGENLSPGDLLLLSGGIGAGKTTFVQGLAAGLGVTSQVQSPTFTLVIEHEFRQSANSDLRFYHIDLYRMASTIDELQTIGLSEYLDDSDAVVAVEWPERAAMLLPEEYLLVHLMKTSETERQLLFLPSHSHYLSIVEGMLQRIAGSDQ